MTELAQVLQEVEDFSVEGQEPVVMKWVEEKGYKLGDVMNAFRLALVGIGKGPGMFDISAFLGKEETLRRLHRAISELGKEGGGAPAILSLTSLANHQPYKR